MYSNYLCITLTPVSLTRCKGRQGGGECGNLFLSSYPESILYLISERYSVVEMRHAWSDANTMGGAITHAAILKMLVSDAKDLIHPENASAPVEMDITARKERNSVVYALRAVLPVKAPLQSVPVVTLSDFVKVQFRRRC